MEAGIGRGVLVRRAAASSAHSLTRGAPRRVVCDGLVVARRGHFASPVEVDGITGIADWRRWWLVVAVVRGVLSRGMVLEVTGLAAARHGAMLHRAMRTQKIAREIRAMWRADMARENRAI